MYKSKDIEQMKFDCFYNGVEYMDYKNCDIKELNRFLYDWEYINGRKWKPIYLGKSNLNTEAELFAIIDTLYKHNYITCFCGEIERDMHGFLHGESSLLKQVQESNFREVQEKKRVKYMNKRYKNEKSI